MLTGVIDENGNRFLSWTYDAFARVATSIVGVDANSNGTSISYNDTSGSRTVTNAFGVADTYSFTTLQNVPKVTAISRAATSTTEAAERGFTYDTNGYMASATDWNGNLTTYVNNSYGDPTTVAEAVGTTAARTTTITYDPTWIHLPGSIVTPGVTASFSYDQSGEELTKTLTDTTTSTIPYSTSGQTRTWTRTWKNYLLSSVQTPNGKTTNFGYDGTGAPTSLTDALNHVTTITAHSGGGLPQTIVDPNKVTNTLGYDGRQRPTSSTVTGSSGTYTTSWGYDAAGNLITTTLPDNSSLTNGYDSEHRVISVTNALGDYINFTLDALGDRTQTSVYKNGGTLRWQRSATFDALGRELVGTAGAGQTTTRTYDPVGNTLSVEDGLDHITTTVYDALNRPSATTDANNGTTTPAYDSHDRVISVTDANKNKTSYIRDGFGDVVQQISPDSGTSVFHYDSDANLTSKTDALGIVTNQTFDELDRALTTTYPAHTAENVAYTYDQTGTGFSFGIGRLTSVTDAAGSLTRAYEERGNLTSEMRVNGANTLTTLYSYDGANRIASMTYPDSSLITYQHDAAGYVSTVTAKLPGASTTTTLATLTHQPFGPMNGLTYGNGIAETWKYDQSYRPTSITDVLSGNNLQNLTYGYDLADNVKSITDAVNASNSQTLGYDVVNRLTNASSGPGGYGSFTWSLDKLGNRLTQLQGATVTTYGYTTGTNRLATITTGTAMAQRQSAPRLRRPNRLPRPASTDVAERVAPRPSPMQTPGNPPEPRSMLARALGWPMLVIGVAGLFAFRRRLLRERLLGILVFCTLLTGSTTLLIGCSKSLTANSDSAPEALVSISGALHGGQQPVAGATIQLYAVGTTGDASPATPLIKTVVQTTANGTFSIASDFKCPTASTEVYIVATGGNPGLSSGTNNSALAEMAALGPCGALNASTFVSINELTTIGSLAALYPYMSSVTNLGSGTSDAAMLSAAFALVNEYTNTTTGTVAGPALPSGYYASSIEMATLGDIIASCINSAGGVAGDGSPCGTLFALATPIGGSAPTDTVGTILDILKSPNLNVEALYDLYPPTAPFQPTLSAAPPNWSLPIVGIPGVPSFSVPSGTYTSPQTLAITDSDARAAIYYTTDGSVPNAASYLYTAPITVASSQTIQAIAVQGSANPSGVATAAYMINISGGSTTTVLTNANGNITGIPSADGVSYVTATYNNANRLASVAGTPVAATYAYDWAGQRYSKTEGGIPPTIFSYAQGGTLIAENNNGVVTDYVYVDGRPIATLQPSAVPTANQVNYIIADHLGTPQLASNNSGVTVWKTAFQPFGATGTVTASITQNLRLPGQYADAEAGFSYNLNRNYMPNLGRYLEADPVGLRGGLNTYAYASGNPLGFADKYGLCDQCDNNQTASNISMAGTATSVLSYVAAALGEPGIAELARGYSLYYQTGATVDYGANMSINSPLATKLSYTSEASGALSFAIYFFAPEYALTVKALGLFSGATGVGAFYIDHQDTIDSIINCIYGAIPWSNPTPPGLSTYTLPPIVPGESADPGIPWLY